MINTDLCDLLNIEFPIIQGGMAWVSDYNLASAVSMGNGLGIIAAMNSNAEQLRHQIAAVRERTDKPFGVNIMLMSPYAEEVARVVVEEKVPIVTTGAGNPSKYMPFWIENGVKVIPVVASVGLAKMAQKYGACAVIAEGTESGGHIGELTTMTLVPQVCDAVQIPVIAAGGIADGRGFASALMLGAKGVQMGTVFLTAKECTIHSNYKERVLKAKDIDTISTGKRLGHPVRSLKTNFSRELFKHEYDANITNEQLEEMGVGALRRAVVEGNLQTGCFMAGQIAGLLHEERYAKEIMQDILSQAEVLLRSANTWVR